MKHFTLLVLLTLPSLFLSPALRAFCTPSDGTRVAEWSGLIIFDPGAAEQSIAAPIFTLEHEDGTPIPIIVPVIQQQALPATVEPAACQFTCQTHVVQSGSCESSVSDQTMTIDGGTLTILEQRPGGYVPSLKGTLDTSVGPIIIHYIAAGSNDNWGTGLLTYQQGGWMPRAVPFRYSD